MKQKNKNKYTSWWFTFKLFLVLIALVFIYLKVFNREENLDYILQLKIALAQPGITWIFIAVFFLMILNWTIEAIKWKMMMEKLEAVSLGRSVEAVLSGLTISFFTPNRIGEYAGRVFHLRPGKRIKATLVTIIENCSQLLITIITGVIASLIYLSLPGELPFWIVMLLKSLLIISGFFCIFIYFNVRFLEVIFEKLRLPASWKEAVHVFSLYSTGELLKVTALAFLRYSIFTLQFYLLLQIYGSSVPFDRSILMILMTFFVMTIVPTFTLTEIGIRGAVSAYFFSQVTIDLVPVLNATFSLWFINLVIPALTGAFFLLNFRLSKNEVG
jgi:uncharacterized membrane protein YbhN (UPF0104 family)